MRHDFIKKKIWGKTIRLKSEIFEIFSKLKKDIDRWSFPADHPLYASPECPWWLWHQNDAKIIKVRKTYFQAPQKFKKIAISRKPLDRIFSTTFTRRYNSPFKSRMPNFSQIVRVGKKIFDKMSKNPFRSPPNNQKNCNISKTARQNFFTTSTLRHNFPF